MEIPKPDRAIGGWPPPGLAKAKTLRSVKPSATEEREYEVPAWFARVGMRSFTVATDFGVVRCKMPRPDEIAALVESRDDYYAAQKQEKTADEKMADMNLLTLLASIRATPADWRAEETVKVGDVLVAEGTPLPQPHNLPLDKPPAARAYLGLLPPTLFEQIVYGLELMQQMAPLDLEKQTNPPLPA